MKGIYKYGVIALTVVVVAAVVHQSPVISFLKLNPSGTDTVNQTADNKASANDKADNRVARVKYAPPDLHLAKTKLPAKLSSVQQQLLVKAIKHSPILFEKNQGQTDKRVKYVSRRPGASLFLTKNEAVLCLSKIEPEIRANSEPTYTVAINASAIMDSSRTPRKAKSAALRLKFVGANPNVRVEGDSQKDTVVNYYIGNDPEKWQEGVTAYGKARYRNLYPGIDLVFYGNGSSLEYDYEVAPGADPSQIKLGIEGAESIKVDVNGDMVMSTACGETRLKKPVTYQVTERSTKLYVPSSFSIKEHEVTLRLGQYNTSLPLTIDPVLVFSSFLGGRNQEKDNLAITSDNLGGIWCVGETWSLDFPLLNAFYTTKPSGRTDTFVAHFSNSGQLLSSTYLLETGDLDTYDDGKHWLAAPDGSGGVWITGNTSSQNFVIKDAQQRIFGGVTDAFVTHIASNGGLLSSSYIGGSGREGVVAVTNDGVGGVWLVGYTWSYDFPLMNAFDTAKGLYRTDGFACHLDFYGHLRSSTYLGGSNLDNYGGDDSPTCCTSDGSQGVWVTGVTESSDFPLKWPFQYSYAGNTDGFVAHIDAEGGLLSSSYFGKGGRDHITTSTSDGNGGVWLSGYDKDNISYIARVRKDGSLATTTSFGGGNSTFVSVLEPDGLGGAWAGGNTSSTELVTKNAFQDHLNGKGDAFVLHVNKEGSLLLSTYIGGNEYLYTDRIYGVCADQTGGIWVAGTTGSTDFVCINPIQEVYGGSNDLFIVHIGAAGSILFSSFLGGAHFEYLRLGFCVVADGSSGIWLGGTSLSTNFPVNNAYQPSKSGNSDAFLSHVQERKSGIISFSFTPSSIFTNEASTCKVITWGNAKAVWVRADAGQNVSTNPIICKRNGNLWTATVSAISLKNRTNNPVTFTATAVTTDSGSPTMWSQLAIVDSGGNIAGIYNDTGQMVKGIVCDNPVTFDDLAPTDTDILNRANKLEIRLPSGMVALYDQGSVCLSGATSTDGRGNPNAGIVVVKDNKVWYLPPDEFNYNQKPSSIVDVLRTPLRNVTVKTTIKLTDGRIVAFSPLSITLARPVVVLVHGINSDIHKWEDYIFGVNGTYLDGPAIPYAILDHSSVHKGNGPVEYGAMKLQELSSNAIWRVNAGTFLSEYRKYSGGNQVYSFQYYRNRPLSCKRVDIVAHSYGGVIARWYLASNGSSDSLSWYQRQGTDTSIVTSPANFTQKQNVRKLLTIGSMWRGVPLANYVNEAHFKYEHDGRKFYDAPTFWNPSKHLGEWLSNSTINTIVPTDAPSMEVMASDSPWISYLIYNNANPNQSGLTPDPFLREVAYGSVAGNKEYYLGMLDGVYGTLDDVQQPSWFPYLTLERKTGHDEPGYNDGLVPVWSAAIPASFTTVFANHSELPGHIDTHNYCVQWLNNCDLPLGAALSNTWQQSALDLADPISGGSWRFLAVRMMPQDRSIHYLNHVGIGRLHYESWGPQ